VRFALSHTPLTFVLSCTPPSVPCIAWPGLLLGFSTRVADPRRCASWPGQEVQVEPELVSVGTLVEPVFPRPEVFPAGLLTSVGACVGAHCAVCPLGDVGGCAATASVCATSAPVPHASVLSVPECATSPLWVGAASCPVALALAFWRVSCPDCRRTCSPTGGVRGGLANSCGVLLLPLPPVGRLLVFRGPGNGRRHQLVSAGSWISPRRRGFTQSFVPCLAPLSRLCCPVPATTPCIAWPCLRLLCVHVSRTLGRRASKADRQLELELELVSAGARVALAVPPTCSRWAPCVGGGEFRHGASRTDIGRLDVSKDWRFL
jgi:hypothetical protein